MRDPGGHDQARDEGRLVPVSNEARSTISAWSSKGCIFAKLKNSKTLNIELDTNITDGSSRSNGGDDRGSK